MTQNPTAHPPSRSTHPTARPGSRPALSVFLSVLVAAVLLSASFIVPVPAMSLPPAGTPEELEIYDVSLVPRFNLTFVEFPPGETFHRPVGLINHYSFQITNVTVSMEVYLFATIKEAADVRGLEHPPRLSAEGEWASDEQEGWTSATFFFPVIEPGEEVHFTHTITTDKKTPQGTYFVRTSVSFQANKTNYVMKSRGYFDDDTWKKALNTTVNLTIGDTNITYPVNITLLGVDGITPDTSFTVKKPRSLIPFFALAALAGFFGISALVFYLQEEYNMFPRAEWAYRRVMGKIYVWKSRLERRIKRGMP